MPLKCKLCYLEKFINKGAVFLRSSSSFGILLKKSFLNVIIRLKSKKSKKNIFLLYSYFWNNNEF